jgi:superfamily II DNA helicase RecQ
MLPAYCVLDGVKIVIAPLVALEDDMVQRCQWLGINGYIYGEVSNTAATSITVTGTPCSAHKTRDYCDR